MHKSNLPINEGIKLRTEKPELGSVSPDKIKTSSGTQTFIDLSEDYVLFSHALLLLYGNLPFDPLLQFYVERNSSDRPILVISDTLLFSGLETPVESSFNHLLFGVPKKLWPDLAHYFGTIGIVDRSRKLYCNVQVQKLPIADYFALAKSPKLQFIDIYLLALDTNRNCLHFSPANQPPKDLIKVIKSTPRKETVAFANTLFSGSPNLEREMGDESAKVL